MNDHIAKPVDSEVLYTTLLRWLDASLTSMPLPPRPGTTAEVAVGDPKDVGAGASTPPPGATGPVELRLADVAGLSVKLGLRLVGGRMGTYLRIVRQFAEFYRHGVPGLSAMLAAGDRAGARDAVHSFKGASATLGAESLAVRAAQLEQALLGRETSADLVAIAAELEREIAALVAALDQALGPAGGD
jgi:HPt (histidine-containing phosphotransfer) domain-containing protein